MFRRLTTTIAKMSTAEKHKLCMIPGNITSDYSVLLDQLNLGPIEFHEDVLSAMSTPGTSHVDPTFINIFGECVQMLRRVVFTTTGQPFILSGSGTLGWDSVLCNLMEPNEEVLVVNTGYFGDRFAECASVYGFKPTHCQSPAIGDRPSLESIGKALADKISLDGRPYKMINITHVDTSTGVLMDIKAVSEVVRKTSPQTLISVDGVCSIGGEELRMDEWGVDAVVTASQKALGCPSGLCVFWASQRAIV
jgi:alanine-glyoxylate transaminase/serine-glyoxylate transaminase/serine-pyruvate transaminase